MPGLRVSSRKAHALSALHSKDPNEKDAHAQPANYHRHHLLEIQLSQSPMEQIKPNHSEGANFEARKVRDVIEPAKSISNKVSVKAALDEMQARAVDSSPVIDQRGELLGTVSKNKMNRKVGGFGHDPKTEPVEAHIEKNNLYCFEDQTVAEAEQMMLNAKVGEVPVVTREKLLVGTINIEGLHRRKD